MHKSPEVTRLIHDNFWIVISFAFAQPAIGKVIDDKFRGEWKFLHKSVYENAEIRADRALLEMATQLRVLDDAERLSDQLKQRNTLPFGWVVQVDDTKTEMHFRDMTNKILHGSQYEWRLGDPYD